MQFWGWWFMQIRQRIFNYTDMQRIQNSETFDVLHTFLSLVIAKLCDLRNSRVFLAHPVLCIVIMVGNGTSSSYRSVSGLGFDLAWFSSLSSELSVSSVFMVLYTCSLYFMSLLHSLLYLLVSWTWWYWPLTWLTNLCPWVLWHCWLGHRTYRMKLSPKSKRSEVKGQGDYSAHKSSIISRWA